MFSEPANKVTKVPEEIVLITGVFPEENAAIVASPSTLVASGAEPSSRPKEARELLKFR